MATYNTAYDAPPYAQLLKLGKAWDIPFDSDRYDKMGFSDTHVPTLIELATDDYLLEEWDEKHPDPFWAPVHAWRVLGKLRAEAAIEPLVALFYLEDEEAVLEDLPDVLAQFGVAAIPALRTFINNPDAYEWSVISASNTLVKIFERDPATRTQCIEAITARVRAFKQNLPEINGALISDLCDLQAVESAEVIKSAFYHKTVDLTIHGNWFDVKPDLGLAPDAVVPGPEPDNDPIPPLFPGLPALGSFQAPPTAAGDFPYHPQLLRQLDSVTGRPPFNPDDDPVMDDEIAPNSVSRSSKKLEKQKKAKRKQAKQSRKQNRKKKK